MNVQEIYSQIPHAKEIVENYSKKFSIEIKELEEQLENKFVNFNFKKEASEIKKKKKELDRLLERRAKDEQRYNLLRNILELFNDEQKIKNYATEEKLESGEFSIEFDIEKLREDLEGNHSKKDIETNLEKIISTLQKDPENPEIINEVFLPFIEQARAVEDKTKILNLLILNTKIMEEIFSK